METLFWLRTTLSFALAAWRTRRSQTSKRISRLRLMSGCASTRSVKLVLPIILICMLCLITSAVHAQPPEPSTSNADSTYFWVSGGIGYSNVDEGGGALSYHANVQQGRHLWSLRGTTSQDIAIMGEPTTIRDFGLLYGQAWQHPRWHLSLSAGPSIVWVTRPDSYYWYSNEVEGDNHTMGLAFALQAFYKSNSTGWGAYVFANVNKTQSVAGITLNVHLGILK